MHDGGCRLLSSRQWGQHLLHDPLMLFEQTPMAPLQLSVLLAQRSHTILLRSRLPPQPPSVPETGEPARDEQQEGQEKADHHGAGQNPAIVSLKRGPQKHDLLALTILRDQDTKPTRNRCHDDADQE
jgi:hypothetical protein